MSEPYDVQELRLLLNDAIAKNLNKGSEPYQAYHDKIWERYGFSSFLDTNQYNYYFGLLTGTSDYKNSAGNASWAREELITAFSEAKEAEYVAMLALGMAGSLGGGKPGAKNASNGVNGAGNLVFKGTTVNGTVSNLQQWAKSNGWLRQDTAGGVQQWGVMGADGTFSWRLKIKLEESTRPGLQAGSQQLRIDSRLDLGKYYDPFTGQTGGKDIGTHIRLEQ